MALEQTVKELEAQNAQFQETLLNLAQGQKNMMVLITKKKKTRNPIAILNMGRRFKAPAQPVRVNDVSSEEYDNKEEDGISVRGEDRNN